MHQHAQLLHEWSDEGVEVALVENDKRLTLRDWKDHAPAAASVIAAWPHNPQADSIRLSHPQLAAINDYEAVPLHLPRAMEAWMVVAMHGRIDSSSFAVNLTLEPQQYAHPWIIYERLGALLSVGLRQLRLNPQQLVLFEALDAMQEAGDDIAARLAAWPELTSALHSPRDARIRVTGGLPRVQLERVAKLPKQAMTRREGKLVKLANTKAAWATAAHHRYYLLQP
jgi:hypothetical protein